MFKDSPLLSRIAALGLLACCIAAVYTWMVAPYLDHRAALKDRIATAERLLAEYKSRTVHLDAIAQQLTALRQSAPGPQASLQGSTAIVVGAELQNRIRSLLATAGARLVSAQILPSGEGGEASRITVRTTMSGSIEAVQQVLHTLESGEPRLFIDNVLLNAPRRASVARTGRRNLRQPRETGNVTMQFDVFGYLAAEKRS